MMNGGRFSSGVAALCSALLLAGCASWSESELPETTVTPLNAPASETALTTELRVIGQHVLFNPGQHLLLELPRQSIKVIARQTLETPQHTLETRDIPWANQPIQVQMRRERFTLYTNEQGVLLLDLLAAPLARADILHARRLKLKAYFNEKRAAELILPVSPVLRGRLHEVLALIYDDLEGGDIPHWVTRIERLTELGFTAEAQTLEKTLLDLTTNDPPLHQELRHALHSRPQH